MKFFGSLFNSTVNNSSDLCHLSLEILEERTLLSSVQVYAVGEMGDEAFALNIDGTEVASFVEIGTQLTEFSYETNQLVTADQVRVMFTNDLWDEPLGIDRNLTVDRIVIDGTPFETEDAGVFASGVWVAGVGISDGFLETETLHTDGYFQYASGSEVVVRASGDLGIEIFDLQIDEQTVATFEVTGEFSEYAYLSSSAVSADQIRIVFSESGNPAGIDPNLNVDWLALDGQVIETESPFVYSTATWNQDDGIVPGFGRGETLHTDGYFQFAAGTVLSFQAGGDSGDERFELVIDQEIVQQFEATSSPSDYLYYADRELQPHQIRIQFVNDLYDPENGVDRNLNVPRILLNGVEYLTNAASVYSTGTWLLEDGIKAGLGRGDTLHTDGYFQWQAFAGVADTFSLPEDASQVVLAVTANDILNLDNEFRIARFSNARNGLVQLIDGQLHYTPDPDFSGEDKFSYYLSDGEIVSAPISVLLNVRSSHQQPQTEIDSRVAPELSPSGATLEIQKYVQIPRGVDGRQPRLNAMAVTGNRSFVVADGNAPGEGQIYEITEVDGVATAQLFLDVGSAIFVSTGRQLENSSPQGGLRSLAFHPDFATNGLFYTSVMEERPVDPTFHNYISDSETPIGADSVVIEWRYDFSRGEADPLSYREVFRVGMHVYDHPIKGITFNPFSEAGDEDYGLLYVGHGDGSVQSAVAGDGQGSDALGKVLRIDPLETDEASYSVPSTNPFVDTPTMLDEVYALGFRNPHNLTFAQDGDGVSHLIVAEVGRDNIEEINLVVAGGNYGWALREGPFLHTPEGNGSYGINGNIEPLPADEALNGLVFPTAIWGHEGEVGDTFVAQAIAGGHVIGDPESPLYGQFIFAEFATDARAYHVDFAKMLQQVTTLDVADPSRDEPSELTWATPQELTIMFDHDNDPSTPSLVRDSIKDILDDEPDFEAILSAGKTRADLRFGQGPNGELFILNKRNGWIYLVTNSVGTAIDV